MSLLPDMNNLGFNSQTVNLALLGIAVLFILVASIWGLIRGFKKTLFRGIWLVVTALILFFVTPLVTKFVYTLDISFLKLEFDGTKIVTIKSFVDNYIASNPDIEFLSVEAKFIHTIILKIPGVILNFILYVVLFWLLKIILWPIWAIFSAIFIKKRNIKGEKIKKHRFLGMITGAIVGLFVGSTTLMPIYNIAFLANKIENITEQNSTNNIGIITDIFGDNVTDIIKGIEKSNANKVYTYTGFQQINSAVFKGLTTTVINNHAVNLEDEITTALNAYYLVMQLVNLGYKNMNQTKLNEMLTLLDKTVDTVFESNLLAGIVDKGIPLVADELIKGNNSLLELPTTDIELVNKAIVEAVKEVKTITFANLGYDLKQLIKIAKILNDENVLFEIKNKINSSKDTLVQVQNVTSLFTQNVVNQITQELSNTIFVTKLMPIALDALIMYGVSLLELDNFTLNNSNITSVDIHNLFSGILNTALSVARSIDKQNKFYVQATTFEEIGRLVDIILSYPRIGQQNINLLKQTAVIKITDYIENNIDLSNYNIPAQILTSAIDSINQLTLIDSFEAELEIYGLIFDDVVKIYEDFIDENKINVELVGNVLDTLMTTKLLGQGILNVIGASVDYATTLLIEGFENANSILLQLKDNITSNIVWKNELEKFTNTIDFALEIFNDPKLIYDLTDESKIIEIGSLIDDVKTSNLFNKYQIINNQPVLIENDNLINDIIKLGIDYAKNFIPADFGDFTTALNNIKQNVTQVTSWEQEFTILAGFVNYFMTYLNDDNFVENLFTASVLQEIGYQLNSVKNSKLIGNQISTLIATMLDTLMQEELPETDPNYDITVATLNKVIREIKNNVLNAPTTINWESELGNLGALLTEVEDMNNLNLQNLGAKLDTLIDSNSVILTRTSINTIVTSFIDILINDFGLGQDMINDLKQAVPEITSFASELHAIDQFIENNQSLLNGSLDIDKFNLQSFGEYLDNTNTKLINAIKPHIVIMIADVVKDIDPIFTGVYNDAVANARNITNYKNEFGALQNFIDTFEGYFAEEPTHTLTDLGKALDNLTSTYILRSIPQSVLNELFNSIEESYLEENNQDALDILNDIRQNAETKLENNETTYEQVLSELNSLDNIFNDISNIDENFNAQKVGDAFNSLSNLSIYGKTATLNLATNVIENFINQLLDERGNNPDAPQYEEIDSRINALNDLLDDMAENYNTIDYYTDVFAVVKAILS